jgi:hypothetical protein
MISGISAAKRLTAWLAAGATVAICLAATANAQSAPKYDRHGHVYYRSGNPNVVYQQGPHTRIYVTKRSWLDAGTEVLPGERKFTDYAYPFDAPGTSFATRNNNRSLERDPLSTPSDLGGEPTRFPLY